MALLWMHTSYLRMLGTKYCLVLLNQALGPQAAQRLILYYTMPIQGSNCRLVDAALALAGVLPSIILAALSRFLASVGTEVRTVSPYSCVCLKFTGDLQV